jgi:hypothetical protein
MAITSTTGEAARFDGWKSTPVDVGNSMFWLIPVIPSRSGAVDKCSWLLLPQTFARILSTFRQCLQLAHSPLTSEDHGLG